MKLINICNKVIEFSFYALFLLIPLVLAGDTSELFEFNKMWLAFGLGIIIAVSWGVKSLLLGGIKIQKTLFDIPILLFLTSQILSTLFSWDKHVSIWGYYSRFNGGLLSTILYIFLYYAFVSNLSSFGQSAKGFAARIVKGHSQPRFNRVKPFDENQTDTSIATHTVRRILNISLIAGLIVSLWGIPSHFGYDPTCLIFRGNFDVSCWSEDFQPKVRIFSTLGQPDWLAAYMAILIPVSAAFFIERAREKLSKKIKVLKFDLPRPSLSSIYYLISFILFYVSLLYSGSRSGFLAVWISLAILFGGSFWIYRKKLNLFPTIILVGVLLISTFFIGSPFNFLNKFSYGSLKTAVSPPPPPSQPKVEKPAPFHTGELGGTDSGRIRLLVWQGAINAWKNNPLFGTGVETFAFAYYKYKSPEHNLTSEWNFLYNKAHNEFLNLLATSGIFGLGTYILMIGWFLWKSIKNVLKDEDGKWKMENGKFLVLAFLASYSTISVTNFFGFSVVIVNVYLFLVPAFFLALSNLIDFEKYLAIPKVQKSEGQPSPFQWVAVSVITLFGLYLIYSLLVFWNADKAYGYGNNLNKAGYPQEAFPYLQKAVQARPGEPVFRDEFAVNNAVLAVSILSSPQNKNATESSSTALSLSQEAITQNNQITSSYPNNFVFLKSRIRIFYTLAQIDPNMLGEALDAARRAQALSPNDASINYNLGVIEGQNGNIDEGIKVLEGTIKMKPNYRDPRYALGLFYYQKALDKNGKVVDRSYLEKAKEQMKYILNYIASNDGQAQDTLKTFEEK